MNVGSNDFEAGASLEAKFTCDGTHVQPELHWSDFPADTGSFAITCRDPDAKPVTGKTFTHWVVYNIPASVTSLPQNSPLPVGAKSLPNDAGQPGYYGPCPPPGSGVHHYRFIVYALNVDALASVNPSNFLELFEEHMLAKSEIIGTYTRDQ